MATVPIILDPFCAGIGSTAIPEFVLIIGTNAPVRGPAFDTTTREDIYIDISALAYGASNPNLSLVIKWYSRSGATTGSVAWGARIAAITPGDAVSMEAKNWATAQSTVTAVNGTAKGNTGTTVSITNLDSLTANDEVWLNIYRDTANVSDTMSGDAIITSAYLTYSDT